MLIVQNDKIIRSAFFVERGRGTHFGVVDSEFFSIWQVHLPGVEKEQPA